MMDNGSSMYEPFLEEGVNDIPHTTIYKGSTSCISSIFDFLMGTRWTITTSSITKERGFFCSEIEHCELSDVCDISYSDGCCGTGTILIYEKEINASGRRSSGMYTSGPTMKISGISNGQIVFNCLRDAISELRRSKRGEHQG